MICLVHYYRWIFGILCFDLFDLNLCQRLVHVEEKIWGNYLPLSYFIIHCVVLF